jgi:hypothetical protein
VPSVRDYIPLTGLWFLPATKSTGTVDRLAVDDAGARAQLGQSLDDQRELPRQAVARPAVEPLLTQFGGGAGLGKSAALQAIPGPSVAV